MIVTAAPAGSWLASARPIRDPAARLFCFPHAGGSYVAFSGWRELVPADIEVLSFCYRGRLRRIREEPLADIRPLVAELYAAVEGMLEVPAIFVGHSVGTLVAFELSRQLRRMNRPQPVALIAAGRGAPQLHRRTPELHHLPADKLLLALRELDGLSPSLEQSDEFMSIILPAIRADLRIDETYVYEEEPPLDSAILAAAGLSDPQVYPGDVEAWGAQTRSEFSFEAFAGGHFFLTPKREELLALVRGKLAGWLGTSDSRFSAAAVRN